MTQLIRLMQEGVVRANGHQLTQWTAAYPSGVTTDSLEQLFVINRSSLGESLVRVATLSDFLAYTPNELKYFECRGVGGNSAFDAVAGHVIRATGVDHWLQAGAPYADNDFTIASVSDTSGSSPQLLVGNYLQISGYTFDEDDVGRWFKLAGFATSGYNMPAEVVSVVTPGTALVRFASALAVTTNETGSSWFTRRLVIETNVSATLEPRYFPTVERNVSWQLLNSGTGYATGSGGETSRQDPTRLTFRDRRVTSILPSLDAALALAATTKAGVALLQVESDTNNTSFLGVTQTDYPE